MKVVTHVNELVIGIDGGGTKTVAWLAPLNDPENTIVLGRGHAGPGNPRAVGFESAQTNIDAAIAAAFADAKQSRRTVAAACFGLAGAGREAEQNRISAWATDRKIASRVHVTGDAEPILAAASPSNCGIALICGTGSLAWGRNASGQIARCGGWGYLLGDEGSAYAIARDGLKAAFQSLDRDPSTTLLARFQERLRAATPDELIDRIYSAEMTRQRLASLADVVFAAAASDRVAKDIVLLAADDLTEMIGVVGRQLGFVAGRYTLAITGGILLNQAELRDHLTAGTDQLGYRPKETVLVREPARGAVALARDQL
jgi:N-acetylglucosamine kinase-like BadF-type ATPase